MEEHQTFQFILSHADTADMYDVTGPFQLQVTYQDSASIVCLLCPRSRVCHAFHVRFSPRLTVSELSLHQNANAYEMILLVTELRSMKVVKFIHVCTLEKACGDPNEFAVN
jgi:hypothetical protein